MSKAGKFIAWAAILFTGVGAAVLYWSAGHAQRLYEQSLAEANRNGLFRFQTASYHKGLLRSDAVTVVTVNDANPGLQAMAQPKPGFPLKDFRVVLASDIDHFPALFSAAGPALLVTTRLDERDPRQAAWLAQAGGHDLLHVTTRIGVDGVSTVTLDVKPLTYGAPGADSSFDWGGLQGRFDISDEIRGTLRSAALTARSGGTRMVMGELRYDLDGRIGAQDFFTGRQSVVIDGLRLNGPAGGATAGQDLSVETFALQGEAHTDAATLSVSSDMQLIDLVANGQRVPRFTLRLAADNLELRDLLDAVNTAGARPPRVDPALQSQIEAKLRALLAGRPGMKINELLLDTGSGTLQADLALRLIKAPPPDIEIPALFWLTALDGEAHVTIADSLLTMLATAGARANLLAGYDSKQQPPPADKELDAAADKMVATQLAALEAQGMLLHEGGKYQTHIQLARGQVLINGKPLTTLPAGKPSP
jgi:uncharacterized protein YdgA (DUF945 family)